MIGEVELVDGQHVDNEPAGVAEGVHVRRFVGQAPQDYRGIERHGVERVGGNADFCAFLTQGRDNRDACAETAEGAPQVKRVDSADVACFPHVLP